MAKLPINNFLLIRRSFAVAAGNVRMQPVVSVMTKTTDLKAEISPEPKETFWMRDPKTGNWIPETHFGDVDAAELREKLLSKKDKL